MPDLKSENFNRSCILRTMDFACAIVLLSISACIQSKIVPVKTAWLSNLYTCIRFRWPYRFFMAFYFALPGNHWFWLNVHDSGQRTPNPSFLQQASKTCIYAVVGAASHSLTCFRSNSILFAIFSGVIPMSWRLYTRLLSFSSIAARSSARPLSINLSKY